MTQIKIRSECLQAGALPVMDLEKNGEAVVAMDELGENVLLLKKSANGRIFLSQFELNADSKEEMEEKIRVRYETLALACASQGTFPSIYILIRSDEMIANHFTLADKILKKIKGENVPLFTHVINLSMMATQDQDPEEQGLRYRGLSCWIEDKFEFLPEDQDLNDFVTVASIMAR